MDTGFTTIRCWGFILLTCLSLMACTEEGAPELGYWEGVNDDSLELNSDGTVVIIDNMGGKITGSYLFEGSSTIVFTLLSTDILKDQLEPIEPMTLRATIHIEGNKLSLQHQDEKETEIYYRTKH